MLTRRRLLGATVCGTLFAGQHGWPFIALAQAADSRLDPSEPTAGALARARIRVGGAWLPIVTPNGASAATVASADALASEVGRLSGSTPQRISSSSARGLRVGLASEWSQNMGAFDWSIATVAGKPFVLGSSDRGLQVAIRRLLYLLGHRRLTTTWEIVPTFADTIRLPEERRNFGLRYLRGLGGTLADPDGGTARQADWAAANGVVDDGLWAYGHAYSAIWTTNKTDFDAHSEWTGAGFTKASQVKFCVYEPGLIATVRSYVQAQFAADSTRRGASVSASDGGGWDLVCSGTDEQATSSASDRQLYLANQVQAVLGADQHAMILAYADTSLPPTITVDPNVVIVWTTAFVHGGQTPEQVRDAYQAAGALLHGPYEYPSEWLWDFDQPHLPRASRRDDLATSVARCSGAIGWACESSAAWAISGRWYWALAGVMVGDDALSRWDAWPTLAFPSAAMQAAAWYAILDTRVPLSPDLVHRLAQAASDLIAATPADTGEHERALDCGRYAVHLDLYRAYVVAPSATTLEPLLQWDYRIRSRDLITYRAPYDTSTWATDRRAVAALHGLSDLADGTVWADAPTIETEIAAALATAVANNALIPFATVGFSQDLVRVSGLTSSTPPNKPPYFDYQLVSGSWWVHGSGTLTINARGGRAYQDKGPDHFRLYDWASGEVLLDCDVPEDRVARDYVATLEAEHLYRLEVTCAGGVSFKWTRGFGFTLLSTELVGYFAANLQAVFYVPKNTQTVGFYAQAGTIKLYDATGAQVGGDIVADHDYYSVAVPQDRDGSVWEITGVGAAWGLLTVPPGFALAADELLVPREVAELDGLAVVP